MRVDLGIVWLIMEAREGEREANQMLISAFCFILRIGKDLLELGFFPNWIRRLVSNSKPPSMRIKWEVIVIQGTHENDIKLCLILA